MKQRLLLGLSAVAALASTPARADDAACLDSATKGQRFRDTHKLVQAREQLRVCAAAACPTVVQSDCASWLAIVEKALPSVVVTAKDGEGASLIEVKVTVDGQPFATRLDGQAVLIDPGSHTFHFEGPAGTAFDQVLVVPEGEQNQRVAVVLGKKAPPPAVANVGPPPPAAGSPATENGDTSEGTAPSGASQGGAPWKTVGWVAGGVGLVGLGLGTVFGMMAISDHNSADCNSANVCLTGQLNDAKGAAVLSDVGLVVGGVLLATGLGIVLFAPGRGAQEHPSVTASMTPVLAPGGGGLVVGGAW